MSDPSESARIGAVENRVTAVEIKGSYAADRLDRIEAKIDALSERMTRSEECVEHLPRKGFIVTAVVVALTLLGGLFVLLNNLKGLGGMPSAGQGAGPASARGP